MHHDVNQLTLIFSECTFLSDNIRLLLLLLLLKTKSHVIFLIFLILKRIYGGNHVAHACHIYVAQISTMAFFRLSYFPRGESNCICILSCPECVRLFQGERGGFYVSSAVTNRALPCRERIYQGSVRSRLASP
jgi:hypothetical protein